MAVNFRERNPALLLIDEDRHARALLARRLMHHGYTIVAVDSVHEVKALFDKYDIDAVIALVPSAAQVRLRTVLAQCELHVPVITARTRQGMAYGTPPEAPPLPVLLSEIERSLVRGSRLPSTSGLFDQLRARWRNAAAA